MKMLLAWAVVLALSAHAETNHFAAAEAGQAPAGWTSTQTGEGASRWTIERDDSAPSPPLVLQQSGKAAYPLCLLDRPLLKDGFVEVKFKPLTGKEDQAGGVVWRAKDAGNYYIARANALENNVRIYHFVNGKRTQFHGVNIPVAAQQWHTLRVTFSAHRFTVSFNGRELFTAEDHTHKEAGRVGLWTKADSVTLFDDFAFDGK